MGSRTVWARLAAAQPRDFAPLLTAEEIGRWRDQTLDWFEKLKEEPKIEPVHITDADVQDFIDRAVGMIDRYFAVWQAAVWHGDNNPGG